MRLRGTNLQCLQDHVDYVANGVSCPQAVAIDHTVSNIRRHNEGDVLVADLPPKRYDMVVAQQTPRAPSELSQDLDMLPALAPHRSYPYDNV